LRYAGPDRCTIDWFPAPGRNAESPLLIFFHGGFWRAGDKRVFSFLAEPYLAVGISVALMGYELAPSVTITTIGEQAAEGVAWLMTQARDLRFGAHRVTLSGHSAGGHLSALLSTLPPSRFGAPFNGVLPISGIFNLAPMLLTSINHEARITAPETISESPALRGAFYGKRYFLVAGGAETEGFVDQTTEFADLLKAQGFECSMTLATGRMHFDIFEEFVSNDSSVYRQTLSVILG
jgi:arylformamidase